MSMLEGLVPRFRSIGWRWFRVALPAAACLLLAGAGARAAAELPAVHRSRPQVLGGVPEGVDLAHRLGLGRAAGDVHPSQKGSRGGRRTVPDAAAAGARGGHRLFAQIEAEVLKENQPLAMDVVSKMVNEKGKKITRDRLCPAGHRHQGTCAAVFDSGRTESVPHHLHDHRRPVRQDTSPHLPSSPITENRRRTSNALP